MDEPGAGRRKRRDLLPRRRALKLAAATACVLLLAFAVWMIVGEHGNGVVADAGDVPVIGYALEGLKTLGPVRLAYHWWYKGHTVVVSGRADLAALRTFGDSKGLVAGGGLVPQTARTL